MKRNNQKGKKYMNSQAMKESMKLALVTIGVIVTVALVAWIGHEVLNVREEIGRGLSWMSSFL
jgi:hypothetical protein